MFKGIFLTYELSLNSLSKSYNGYVVPINLELYSILKCNTDI